jgi:hypothetical protein
MEVLRIKCVVLQWNFSGKGRFGATGVRRPDRTGWSTTFLLANQKPDCFFISDSSMAFDEVLDTLLLTIDKFPGDIYCPFN